MPTSILERRARMGENAEEESFEDGDRLACVEFMAESVYIFTNILSIRR